MKVIIDYPKEKQSEYPKLMVSDKGMIVLFMDPKIGTVIYQGEGATRFGSYSRDFNMRLFKDFEGKVIISNQ